LCIYTINQKDLEAGAQVNPQIVAKEFAAHPNDLNCVEWCPVIESGLILATCSDDNTIRLWSLAVEITSNEEMKQE
jgi:WD40 repeat protein